MSKIKKYPGPIILGAISIISFFVGLSLGLTVSPTYGNILWLIALVSAISALYWRDKIQAK